MSDGVFATYDQEHLVPRRGALLNLDVDRLCSKKPVRKCVMRRVSTVSRTQALLSGHRRSVFIKRTHSDAECAVVVTQVSGGTGAPAGVGVA